jgi:hypothetical protein
MYFGAYPPAEHVQRIDGDYSSITSKPKIHHPGLEPREGVDPNSPDYFSQLGETRGD